MVTIVVPVYNMAQYLERAVETLLKQTYKDIEIILVDDGSTDNCPQMCDEYADKYEFIRTIHKENGGLSSARNCGIENAKGEYVIFSDPDDWVDEDYIESLIALKEKYPDSLPIVGYYIDTENKTTKCIQYNETLELIGEDALVALMQSSYYNGFTVNKLYSLDVIKKNNLKFDCELGMAQDLLFSYQYISLCGKVVYDSTPKYHYFQHAGGVTNSKITPRKLSGFLTYERIAEEAKQLHPKVSDMARCTSANLALAMLDKYFETDCEDKNVLDLIMCQLKKDYKFFIKSKYHSFFRKWEIIIALGSPKIYYCIRKLIRR